MTPAQKFLKRAFDVTGAALGLAVLSPVMLVLMLGVKLTSPGPALYRQRRVGQNGNLFWMLKLRTMRYSPEDEGSHITTSRDDRVTPHGRFLRRHKLDEVPQLWNVLKGDMSFVGPRPDVPGYADQLRGDERRVLDIRPGITGPASLYYRDEEDLLAEVDEPVEHNDRVLYPMKTRLNLEYLESWSFTRDFGYLLLTVLPSCNRWLRLLPEREPPLERDDRSAN